MKCVKIIRADGFTLLELMVVLLIVGILATVAYPAYTSHLTKARRAEGKIALLTLASAMDRYYAENNYSYKGASLNKLGVNSLTEHGFYKLSIAQATLDAYLLRATPLGVQAKYDTLCKVLTLDQLGQKGGCW